MKVIKKINNNIAIAIDGTNHEVVLFGKGIGFPQIPYEMTDMTKVERSFYDIDERYYGLLNEVPNSIFLLTTKMIDVAKRNIDKKLNPNLVFILADHFNFAITRQKKGMNIALPYSYELEYEYPELTKISKWMLKIIREKLNVELAKGEVTSITTHFINALAGTRADIENEQLEQKISKAIKDVTSIVEQHFVLKIDRKSFNYFRFKNHLKYFVQRKEKAEMYTDSNETMFEDMKNQYPQTYACILKIDDYFEQQFNERCTREELLYVMIHVNRLYLKEDCNRKGITP